MIVPTYWAEATLQEREARRQITIRRFGWSDSSPEEAQAQADERAREAMRRARSGESVLRREPRVAYNGAEGVPIREEILSRQGETVVTRNSYGAHCLNTPDVLFVDVDFGAGPGGRLILSAILSIAGIAAYRGLVPHATCLKLILAGIACVFLGIGVALLLHRIGTALRGGEERVARGRVARFVRRRPDWHVRLYRTPKGLRVMALHRTFDPSDAEVADCFRALRADPMYAKMCRRQRCFRARVSPKPWRVGIAAHMKPRPGVWPVRPERMTERAKWIGEYEAACKGYSSCRFLVALGKGAVHPAAREVQVLHDKLAGADTSMPMA